MKIILTLLVLLISVCASATSLQESIQTAFQKNPITQSNDMRLEAARLNAKGVHKDLLPSPSFSCSVSQYNSSGDYNYQARSRGCSMGIDVTIYDGHAGRHRAAAADLGVEALEATHNATDALIPNTKGSLARDVFDTYSMMVEAQSYIEANEIAKGRYTILLEAAKTEEQKKDLKSKLANVSNSTLRLNQWQESNVDQYEFYVRTPAPDTFDTFEQMAASLEVPLTAENAINIALLKSPDIIRYKKSLASAQEQYKAQMKQMFSPKINGGVSYGYTQSGNGNPLSKSKDTYTYITVSVPLGLSRGEYSRASALELQAKEKDLERTLNDIQYSISRLYKSLRNNIEMTENYRIMLEKSNDDINELMKKVQNHQPVDIPSALSIMSDYGKNVDSYVETQKHVVEIKFNIQKTIGTLFEKNLRVEGVNQSPR